jgi:hypothetical protein
MRPNGCAVTTYYDGMGPNFFCGVGDACAGCFVINKGDCICFTNCVQSGSGYAPLCSDFRIISAGASAGLTLYIGSPDQTCVPHS